MAERSLTGTRVRNRRISQGLRQTEVARQIGISGSYLNLIEHNRRRIGGKVLQDLARVLDIDPALLEEEVSSEIAVPLREALADFPEAQVEGDQIDALVAQFPGWASLIAAQRRRIAQLEARAEALGNRLAHDTQISTSLHEVISTATAIRSTASILVETPDLDADWRGRFHRNIDGDSARLAESSQALLGLLDTDLGDVDEGSAVDQAQAILAREGFHAPACEAGDVPAFVSEASPQARPLLKAWAAGYAADAEALPLEMFEAACRQDAFDPARIMARFGVSARMVLRRMAQLPNVAGRAPMGLAVCDGAGVVTFQKPVLDFRLPRAAAACPLWPLYQALSQPGRALHSIVRLPGAAHTAFECFAIAEPVGSVAFGAEPRIEATMLVRPAQTDAPPRTVGPGCRLCPVEGCDSRRQPSILRDS